MNRVVSYVWVTLIGFFNTVWFQKRRVWFCVSKHPTNKLCQPDAYLCNLVVILYYWWISEEISLTQCYYHKIFASNPRDKTIICLQSQRVCVGRWLGHMIFQGSASAKGLAWLRVSLVTTSFYWRYIVGTGLAAWERVLWLVKLVLSSIFFGPK